MARTASVVADILTLFELEHELYRELLDTAREQARFLEGSAIRSLQSLVAQREDLYARIEASEQARQAMMTELVYPPDEIRRAAEAIGQTLRAILKQDQLNEVKLRDAETVNQLLVGAL